MKELLVVWLYSVMTLMSPIGRPQYIVEAQESREQAEARYKEIAQAIIDVSFDPQEDPIFTGRYGRSRTALFIAFKFYMESGFRRDVHLGLGRARLGKMGWNDNGRSWCMGQIMLGRKRVEAEPGVWVEESQSVTPEGWSGRDLVGDTHKCVTSTLRTIRRSLAACHSLPSDERLAAYAAGSCASERGRAISRARMSAFRRWTNKSWPTRPSVADIDVLTPHNSPQASR